MTMLILDMREELNALKKTLDRMIKHVKGLEGVKHEQDASVTFGRKQIPYTEEFLSFENVQSWNTLVDLVQNHQLISEYFNRSIQNDFDVVKGELVKTSLTDKQNRNIFTFRFFADGSVRHYIFSNIRIKDDVETKALF
jgi:hypothetical protein|nr:MAG TPA: hypothetical protein [Caudoviricetes sp.]